MEAPYGDRPGPRGPAQRVAQLGAGLASSADLPCPGPYHPRDPAKRAVEPGERGLRSYGRTLSKDASRPLLADAGPWPAIEALAVGAEARRHVASLSMDAKVLLCDFAEVSGGKLFVSGAGLALVSSATPTPPFRVNITLAVLGLINIGDTDLQHKMTIELVNVGANGETRVMLSEDLPDVDTADKGMIIAYFVAPRSPQMLPADEWSMPMAIPLFGLGLPVLGALLLQRADRRQGNGQDVISGHAVPGATRRSASRDGRRRTGPVRRRCCPRWKPIRAGVGRAAPLGVPQPEEQEPVVFEHMDQPEFHEAGYGLSARECVVVFQPTANDARTGADDEL